MTAKRTRVPRVMLVYCEGKTEEAYFNTLLDFYRPPMYVDVDVKGQKGQHIALIDNVMARRAEVCQSEGLRESEVECWAVCDEDLMPVPYTELVQYAEENGVNLAFSAPQFELYLLQHFEQSGTTNISEVFEKLTIYRNQNGGEGSYDSSTKADLGWMARAIDKKPKIVGTAVTNSELRERASKRPFFTVHNLTKRIMEIAI